MLGVVMVATVVGVVAMDDEQVADAAVGDQFTVGELIYEVTGEGEVEVADTTSTSISGELVIPSSVLYGSSDYQVTSIGHNAFNGCSELTSIDIPDSVTFIGNSVFQNCYALTSVNIPDGVTSIGNYTFGGCGSLTSIDIPDSVTSIKVYAFYACHGLTSVVIPINVTSIGFDAFKNCTGLTSVTFKSETAPSLGKDSFDTGTTIYVRTPGWDPEIPFEDAYSLGTNIVWVKFSDLTFESDPVADGIIAYVTRETP